MNDFLVINDKGDRIAASPWGVTRKISGKSFWARLDFAPHNERISVLDYNCESEEGLSLLVKTLEGLCLQNGFGKVWGKFKKLDAPLLVEYGFIAEAGIKDYFGFQNDSMICSRFFFDRCVSNSAVQNNRVLQDFISYKAIPSTTLLLDDKYSIRLAQVQDMVVLADLYRQVFATYPYPVFDPAYLLSTLDHIKYGLIFRDEVLAATASAEINWALGNAEMTDFATLPSERGKGLGSILLNYLEQELTDSRIKCLYTIARSTSIGMNRVFARADYEYTGTLVNNCNIAGGFEDMNVLCKSNY